MHHVAVSFQQEVGDGENRTKTEERKLLVHRCSMGLSTSFYTLAEEANTERIQRGPPQTLDCLRQSYFTDVEQQLPSKQKKRGLIVEKINK